MQIETAKSQGWQEVQNGSLLKLVVANYDVFVTVDQNMEYQQNLAGYQIAVVILSTNNFRKIKNHVDAISQAIESTSVGTIARVQIH